VCKLGKSSYGDLNKQEFPVRVAHKLEEAYELLNAGFEHV